MLKKVQTTVIVLSLIALAVPAFATDLNDNLLQDGVSRQLHIVPLGQDVELVSGLNDADFDYFGDTSGKICAATKVEHKVDIRDTDESIVPYAVTAD